MKLEETEGSRVVHVDGEGMVIDVASGGLFAFGGKLEVDGCPDGLVALAAGKLATDGGCSEGLRGWVELEETEGSRVVDGEGMGIDVASGGLFVFGGKLEVDLLLLGLGVEVTVVGLAGSGMKNHTCPCTLAAYNIITV